MTNSDHDAEHEPDQHSQDRIGFKEHYQYPDAVYGYIRAEAERYLRQETDWGKYVDLSAIELRRWLFEDGVISFDATHPAVVHEDELLEMDPEDVTPVEEVDGEMVVRVDTTIRKLPNDDSEAGSDE